jgi:hypothetical protein
MMLGFLAAIGQEYGPEPHLNHFQNHTTPLAIAAVIQ